MRKIMIAAGLVYAAAALSLALTDRRPACVVAGISGMILLALAGPARGGRWAGRGSARMIGATVAIVALFNLTVLGWSALAGVWGFYLFFAAGQCTGLLPLALRATAR